MQKILLYYKFIPIPDPDTVRLWQRTLCENLNLKGRILISEHGINGTIGGDLKNLKQYVKSTKASPLFKTMAFKWSDSAGDDFPKLVIKVRSEIVTFGLEDKLKVNETGVVGGGQKLKPKQVHELVNKKSGEVVFFDGRNAHEARIGRFKNAIVPEVDNTRDFAKELKKPKYNDIKDKPVVTYCTGGIRCEVLSKMMIDEGFKEVYQMDGGIVKYGEEYGDQGLWEGSLYVFDGRIATQFSDKAKDIGDCAHCETKTSNYENCENKACNKLILVCENCQVIGKCKDCSLQTVK